MIIFYVCLIVCVLMVCSWKFVAMEMYKLHNKSNIKKTNNIYTIEPYISSKHSGIRYRILKNGSVMQNDNGEYISYHSINAIKKDISEIESVVD